MCASPASRIALHPEVPLETLPEALRGRLGPEAPLPVRKLAARGLLPVEPAEMVAALAYLTTHDPDTAVRDDALAALTALPPAILGPVLRNPRTSPPVLAVCTLHFLKDSRAIEAIVLNAATPDEAVAYVAARGEGAVLDMVANNQVRMQRHARIAEALYFNPQTPTGTAARAIEFAVRAGLDLSHIPGFREIAQSIFGEVPEEAPVVPPDAPVDPAAVAVESGDKLLTSLAALTDDEEISDEMLAEILREEQADAQTADETEEKLSREKKRSNLWVIIRDMTIAQKVRLALMGNLAARGLLIRDTNRLVTQAVLRSPMLTEREIIAFAGNRALPDEVIRTIANTREWTKSYPTRRALVANPKTPTNRSLAFLRLLSDRDVKTISRDRDVPGHIAVAAKRMLDEKERKGR